MQKPGNKKEGYVAILVVLMIAAAGALLASTMSLVGVGELQSSRSLSAGEGTLTFVEGCAEDAILQARANNSYASGNITSPEGTCSITVSKNGTGNGGIWTITAATTATTYQRTVTVVVVRNVNTITITSWQET